MKAGLWAWIMQRITAVLLIALVGVHLGIMHFVDENVKINFASSSVNLKGALYFLVVSGLLALGLFHGLNGVRNILLDFFPKARRGASWVLWVLGLAFAGYGSTALLAFLK